MSFVVQWLWRLVRRRRRRPPPLPPLVPLWRVGGGWQVECYAERLPAGTLVLRRVLVSPNRRRAQLFTPRVFFPPLFSPD